MFELKPLTQYSLPHYGRTTPDSLKGWASWLLRRGAGGLAALLLVAGLGFAAVSCENDTPTDDSPPVAVDGDSGWEEEDQDTDNCQDGSADTCMKLGAYGAVSHCQDGRLIALTCNEWCLSNGYQAAEGGSTRCAAEPVAGRLCECGDPIEYTDGDGVDAWCDPQELYCQSADEVESCVNNQRITESCTAYCERTKGAGYTSLGCDNALPMAERCQCALPQDGDPEADVIDGMDSWDTNELESEVQEAEREEAGGDAESEAERQEAEREAELSCGANAYLGCTSDGTNRVMACEAGLVVEKSCRDLCPPTNATQDPLAYASCKEPFTPADPCNCGYAVVDGDADF